MFQVVIWVISILSLFFFSQSFATGLALDVGLLEEPTEIQRSLRQAENFIQSDPDLAYLFPKNRKWVILTEEQAKQSLTLALNRVVHDFLSTPLGSKICREMTSGDPHLFIHFFGVTGLQMKNVSGCQPIGQHSMTNQRSKAISSLANLNPRKIVFVLYENLEISDLGIQSWTNSKNQTFVFLNSKNLSRDSFYKTMIHEYAISAIGRVPHIIDSPKSCDVFYLKNDPFVRMSFRTYRAFQVENQILKELNLSPEFELNRCSEDIHRIFSELIWYPIVLTRGNLGYFERMNRTCPSHTGHSENSAEDLKKILDQNPGLCETLGAVGQFEDIGFSEGPKGPRPPIGSGGGGGQQAIEPDSLQILRSDRKVEVLGTQPFKVPDRKIDLMRSPLEKRRP